MSPAAAPIACPLCGGSGPQVFVDLASVPVNCSSFWSTEQAARAAPRGSIRLAFCPQCSYIFNAGFDSALVAYEPGYDNSLRGSAVFRAYEDLLIDELIDRSALAGGWVLEVGCGDGDFLTELCRRSSGTGLGFDPAWPGGAADERVAIVAAPFHGLPPGPSPDLVCCRHVLEHIREPAALMADLRATLGPASALYVEVPDAWHLLSSDDVWDLVYPHCGYFTAPALRRLADDAGIAVSDTTSGFGGQFLGLYGSAARPHRPRAGSTGGTPTVAQVAAATEDFTRRLTHRITGADQRIGEWHRRGMVVALWGAGARAVTFLNMVPNAADVGLVVDVNPRKAGLFVPGSGQAVVTPDDPAVAGADVVLVINPMYADEIRGQLRRLGSSAPVTVV